LSRWRVRDRLPGHSRISPVVRRLMDAVHLNGESF
jgi:hypothetical protein